MRPEPLPEIDPIEIEPVAESDADPLDTDTLKFERKVQLNFTAEVEGAGPLKSALYVSFAEADDPKIIHAKAQEHIDTYLATATAQPEEKPDTEASLTADLAAAVDEKARLEERIADLDERKRMVIEAKPAPIKALEDGEDLSEVVKLAAQAIQQSG